ncbi:hypothetical protein EPO05_01830 [Patescibacteria group bacterium]|nr:MAG: hypothetical protein EPO05_01830 [Patescibacteria group bacterium]
MNGGINDWQSQVAELKKYGIDEVSVFPTALQESGRYDLYASLMGAGVKKIPLFHLKTEMKNEEIDFLLKSFDIETFNLHSTNKWPLLHDYTRWKSNIFLENGKEVPHSKELEEFAGLCVDFSHWHNEFLLENGDYCAKMTDNLERFKTGVTHLSPIKKELLLNPFVNIKQYDSHVLGDLSELDYLVGYKKYLAPINAIELTNSIAEQLRVKEYLEKMLD